jgi:rare lipoprotein A
MSMVFIAVLCGCSAHHKAAQKKIRIGRHETGIASWYGEPYNGRHSANGEIYDMEKLTAAHREYPFDTWLKVKNLGNHREVTVRVTDRGPFVEGRIIDLSKAAARQIDMIGTGTAKVRLEVVNPPKGVAKSIAKVSKQAPSLAASEPPLTNPPGISPATSPANSKAEQLSRKPPMPEQVAPQEDAAADRTASAGTPQTGDGLSTVPSTTTIPATGVVSQAAAIPAANAISSAADSVPVSQTPRARFRVQAGAYRDRVNAKAQVQRLSALAQTTETPLAQAAEIRYDSNRNLWRVIVGEFDERAKAESLASLLRKQHVETSVVDQNGTER